MITRFFKKYLYIVFMVSMFLGSFHTHKHSDTLNIDDDCQICIVQSNFLNADVPKDVSYLSDIKLYSQLIITPLSNLHSYKDTQLLKARAPPLFS